LTNLSIRQFGSLNWDNTDPDNLSVSAACISSNVRMPRSDLKTYGIQETPGRG
jgi:hypothetical protein